LFIVSVASEFVVESVRVLPRFRCRQAGFSTHLCKPTGRFREVRGSCQPGPAALWKEKASHWIEELAVGLRSNSESWPSVRYLGIFACWLQASIRKA